MFSYFAASNKLYVLITLATLTRCSPLLYEETALTEQERVTLKEFRTSVAPKIPPQSYVSKLAGNDLYLIRWLRANSLNASAAENIFLDHLKWREEQEIDAIDNEDWTKYRKEYPMFLTTSDREGRPVLEVWLSDWDVSRAIYSGSSQKLLRWLICMSELQTRKIFLSTNILTQGDLLVDLKKFNMINQGCPSCIGLYRRARTIIEKHYPNLWHSVVFFNPPRTFKHMEYELRRMRVGDLNKVKVYRRKEELDKILERDERSARFGGTLVRNVTVAKHTRSKWHTSVNHSKKLDEALLHGLAIL